MNEFRLIKDRPAVSLDWTLPGNVERVWWHLTAAEGLRNWLAEGRMEPRLGGDVALRLPADDALVRASCEVRVRGVISCFEPHHRLVYSWSDAARESSLSGKVGVVAEVSRVTYNLTRGDGRTLLSLTHSGLPIHRVAKFAAGWHVHLGLLAGALSEDEAENPAFLLSRQRGSYVESSLPGMRA